MKIEPDPISITQLTELIIKYKIETVVINACRSAAVAESSSNMARVLVESGVRVAIGMSFDVLASTAEKFMAAFYKFYLTRQASAIQAVSYARRALRQSPDKSTRFDTTIRVDDFTIPIIHCQGSLVSKMIGNESASDNDSFDSSTLSSSYAFAGREGDVLRLESFLTLPSRNKLHVCLLGEPGVGKTVMLQQSVDWWQGTNLCDRPVYLQLCQPEFNNLTLTKLLSHISAVIDPLQKDVSITSVTNKLNSGSTLLVFDSVESINWSDALPLVTHQQQFRRLITNLRNCSVIVACRSDLPWLGSSIHIRLILNRLNLVTSTAIAIDILKGRDDHSLTPMSRENFEYFEQFVSLSDGNPLAIQILVSDLCFSSSQDSFSGMRDHIFSLINMKPVHIRQTIVDNDPGARSVTKLFDMFKEKYKIHSRTKLSSDKLETAEASLPSVKVALDDIKLCLSMMAFWFVLPTEIEPFITAVVAVDRARALLQVKDFEHFLTRLSYCVQDAHDDSTSLWKMLESSKANKMGHLSDFANTCSAIARNSQRNMSQLLETQFTEFSGPPTEQGFTIEQYTWQTSHYSIHPLLTLVAGSAEMRRLAPSHYEETLKFARTALYDYREGVWMSSPLSMNPASLQSPLKLEVDHNYWNYLGKIVSSQDVAPWRRPDQWLSQSMIAEAARADNRRLPVVEHTLSCFINMAMSNIITIRDKYFQKQYKRYDLSTQRSNSREWERAAALEMSCSSALVQAINCCQFLLRPFRHYWENWKLLISHRMFIHITDMDEKLRNLYVAMQAENTTRFRFMMEPYDPSLLDDVKVASTLNQQARSSVFPDSQYSSYETSTDLTNWIMKTWSEESGWKDTNPSQHFRIVSSIPANATREALQEAVGKLDDLLQKEVEGANDPVRRIVIYSSLATVQRRLKNFPLAAQHELRVNEIKSMLDPRAVTEFESLQNVILNYQSQKNPKTATHVGRLEAQAMDLRREIKTIESDTAAGSQPRLYVALQQLARVLRALRYNEEALLTFRRVIEGRKEFLPDHDKDVLEPMNELGAFLSNLRKYDESIPLLRKVRSEALRSKGLHDPLYLESTSQLGYHLYRQVQWFEGTMEASLREALLGEAKTFLTEVDNRFDEAPESADQTTATTKSRLANFHAYVGELETAERLLVDAKNIFYAVSGSMTDPSVLIAQDDLARLKEKMGKSDEAETLYRNGLDQSKRACGVYHPDTITSMSNLVHHLQKKEQKQKAEMVATAFVDDFNDWIRTAETEGSDAAAKINHSRFLLGSALKGSKYYDRAINMLEIVRVRSNLAGLRTPKLIEVHVELASAYINRSPKMTREALNMKNNEIELRLQLYGPLHAETLDALATKVVLCEELKQWREAEEAQLSLIDSNIAVFGEDGRNTAIYVLYLGQMYRQQGKWPAAKIVFQRACGILGRTNPGSAQFCQAASGLALSCHVLRHLQESIQYRRKTLEAWLQAEGPTGINTLLAQRELGHILSLGRHYGEAKDVMHGLLKCRRNSTTVDTQIMAHDEVVLARILVAEDNDKDAEELIRKVLQRENIELDDSYLLSQLSLFFKERRQYDRATDYRLRDINLTRQAKDFKVAELISSLDLLTELHFTAFKFPEAESTLREILELLEDESPGQKTADMVRYTTVLSKSLAYQNSDSKVDEAEHIARHSIAMAMKLPGENVVHCLNSTFQLARVLSFRNRWVEFLDVVQSCIELLSKEPALKELWQAAVFHALFRGRRNVGGSLSEERAAELERKEAHMAEEVQRLVRESRIFADDLGCIHENRVFMIHCTSCKLWWLCEKCHEYNGGDHELREEDVKWAACMICGFEQSPSSKCGMCEAVDDTAASKERRSCRSRLAVR